MLNETFGYVVKKVHKDMVHDHPFCNNNSNKISSMGILFYPTQRSIPVAHKISSPLDSWLFIKHISQNKCQIYLVNNCPCVPYV